MKGLSMKWSVVVVLAVMWLTAAARAVDDNLPTDIRGMLSRLQSMGHGYHSDSEWQDVFRDISALDARARRAEAWDALMEVKLIEAQVYSDMLRDYGSALRVLEEARKLCERHVPASTGKIYVREAEVYAKLGDEGAINRLITEFKKSPFYDPEKFAYSGGQGRDVPLTVVRPGGKGSDSLSVTAMEMSRQRARFAPGRTFPDFQSKDMRGDEVGLSDYHGKVLLLDFWAQGWEPWRRDVASLRDIYLRYRGQGFDVLGINLERDPTEAQSVMRRENMTWRQIMGDSELTRRLGIFGEATNFLLDKDGTIIARDVRGSELNAAVRKALGIDPQVP